MKKSLLIVGAAMMAAVALTGCFSVNTNDAAVKAPVCLKKQMTPDIKVGLNKVSGEASVNCLFGFITWGVSEYADDAFVCSSSMPLLIADGKTVAKQGATYKACGKSKADYILGAKYRVDTKDYFVFKQIKCKVTGFPGYLKGMK